MSTYRSEKKSSRDAYQDASRDNETLPQEPVRGRDITRLGENLGLTMLDQSYLLGIYTPVLTEIVSRNVTKQRARKGYKYPAADEMVTDPTKALLVRIIRAYPEFSPIPEPASPHEVYEMIQGTPGFEDFSLRDLGPLLGCEAASGYRWSSGASVNPSVERYLTIIRNMLVRADARDRATVIRHLIDIAENEARARGLGPNELWKKGKWKVDKPRDSEPDASVACAPSEGPSSNGTDQETT